MSTVDLPSRPPLDRQGAARAQVMVAAASGILVGVAASFVTATDLSVLIGWDAAALLYLGRVWLKVHGMNASETARIAASEDPTRSAAELLLLGAATASLVAVGLVLVSAAKAKGGPQEGRVALALVSIVISWSVVHAVYALRYAALYYSGRDGGISFNEDEPPDYVDFAYLALTIGMTFQVSDTDLQAKAIRRTALQHALLSYLFGTGIVATTVNLVASLTTK